MEEIIKKVSKYTGIPLELLKSKTRDAEIIRARMFCYKLMRGEKDYNKYGHLNHGYRISLASIGMYFNKGHATILNGIRRLNNYLETEPETRKMYDILNNIIEGIYIDFLLDEKEIIENADCSLPHYKDGKFIGDEIVIEFDRRNIDLYTDEDTVIITLTDPESDIYKQIDSIGKWYMGKNKINP